MRRGAEIAHLFFVAGSAFFRADEFRPGNARRRKNGAARFEVAARKQNNGKRRSSSDHPPEFLALTVEPSS